ncbi:MAG: Fe-S cluster assembly ATPase SufC [Candidatus Woesearchaeota archaeon]
MLEIKDLHVEIDGKKILKGLNLTIQKGKVHALMGPNGSGKSTLANVIMGHPKYEITQGQILLDGKDITELEADERSRAGLFLSFQYPQEIPGLTINQYLRAITNEHREKKLSILQFKKELGEKLALLDMSPEFTSRYLNHGFSGGEKKRSEILQLLLVNPRVAILDETDSGLDIDALKAVSQGVNVYMGGEKAVLIITHYKRILEHIKPDKLSILIDGKIALDGDGSLVDQLEAKGYGWIEHD